MVAPLAEKMRIFLAHSRRDKAIVRDIFFLLGLDGFDPWLDEESLVAGQDWEYEIRKSIEGAHVIAVFLSRNSVDRTGYVHKELALALDIAERQPEGNIFIIPIRLDDCAIPQRLQHLHWLEFPEDGFSVGSQYLRLQREMEQSYRQFRRVQTDDMASATLDATALAEVLSFACAPRVIWANTWKTSVSGGPLLPGSYLVRGRNPDGSKYYGTASISFDGEEVLLVARIGAHQVKYRGDGNGAFWTDEGKEVIRYHRKGDNRVLVGDWGEGGTEELILVSRHCADRDAGR